MANRMENPNNIKNDPASIHSFFQAWWTQKASKAMGKIEAPIVRMSGDWWEEDRLRCTYRI